MNTKNILVTGGRAPVALYLSRILHSKGYNVFMAESLKYHISKPSKAIKKNYLVTSPNDDHSKYIRDLVKIIKQENISLVIPTCEEIFHIALGKNVLEEHCEVFCEYSSLLKRFHSKWNFIQTLKEVGFPISIPETHLISNEVDLVKIGSILHEKGKLVVKPVFSRFGSEVHFVDKDSSVSDTIDFANNRTWVAQEFIKGYQLCTYSVARNGKLMAHSCYQTQYSINAGATICYEPHHNQIIQDFVKAYVSHFSFTGQIAFDFMVSEEGNIYPIECNPRATSGFHLFKEDSGIEKCLLGESTELLIGDHSMMLLFPMLYKYFSSKDKASHWKAIKQAQDVVFSTKDISPFFYQFVAFSYLYLKGKKMGLTPIQVSTHDIEWDGE